MHFDKDDNLVLVPADLDRISDESETDMEMHVCAPTAEKDVKMLTIPGSLAKLLREWRGQSSEYRKILYQDGDRPSVEVNLTPYDETRWEGQYAGKIESMLNLNDLVRGDMIKDGLDIVKDDFLTLSENTTRLVDFLIRRFGISETFRRIRAYQDFHNGPQI